jgi:hypothetical protein
MTNKDDEKHQPIDARLSNSPIIDTRLSNSPIIDTRPPILGGSDELSKSGGAITLIGEKSVYTYILSGIVVGLIVYLIYYSYTCFYENQDIIMEPFTENTIKSDPSADSSFDVDSEVDKLNKTQENNLSLVK